MSTETSGPRLRPHVTPEPRRWFRLYGTPLPLNAAVELDGTLPQSVFALGAIKGYLDRDWPVAIATMRREMNVPALEM